MLDGMASNRGNITEEGAAILARYDMRPNSRAAVEQLCKVSMALTAHLQMVILIPGADPDQALRNGIARMRTELERWSD